MQSLFGIPMEDLMIALLVVLAILAILVTVSALRNPVALKMGIRNIPRRRAQTVLIVVGLMLATALFSASFVTGDTITHSIRVMALDELGQVDVAVRSEERDPSGQRAFFEQAEFERVREALAGAPEVAGVAPLVSQPAPVLNADGTYAEPSARLLGYDAQWMSGFDQLATSEGRVLSVDDLGTGQAYASAELMEALNARQGDTVQVFLGAQPLALEVAGVHETGAHPAGDMSLVLPLSALQAFIGTEGRISAVIISNVGGIVGGAQHTDTVLGLLEPVLEGRGLEAEPLKRDALNEADMAGSTFASIFLLFGQFSVAAGILLIFLIFVMLAAERKKEMGIARAVGMQRGHLIRMFAFEGAAYAVVAAAVGSVLGVAVGMGMVNIMSVAFGQFDLELTYAFNWRSLVIAFSMGMVFTFFIILLSSWRTSRLNIVRAVRDIPEPRIQRRTWKGLIISSLVPVLGVLLTLSGIGGEQMATFALGVSLIIIGLPLVALWLGLRERAAYTAAGLGLVIWWLAPVSWVEAVFPFTEDFQMGIELFFLSGILVVLGAIWVVVYNSDILLRGIVLLFGRIKGMPPVLKTAVSYPMENRFRTGMTLAMFSLVIFTLVVMSFIIRTTGDVFQDIDRISGGFQVRAETSFFNPIPDLRAALEESEEFDPGAFEAIGAFAFAPSRIKQERTEQEPVDFALQSANAEYTSTTTFGFSMMADGYESAEEVWTALREEPGTVVVAPFMVPSREDFVVGGEPPPFQFEGFWREDPQLPEVYLLAQNPATGQEHRLRVIGVLDEFAFFAGMMVVSPETLSAVAGTGVPSTAYMLRLADGQDPEAVASRLQSSFSQHGMRAVDLENEIREINSANLMINNLLQGFMGLGLVVGIAALGVIAARSVVERRQEIGVLRAIGFQKGMVQTSFLLESSYVALMGIFIGFALGIAMSYNIVQELTEAFGGAQFNMPWGNLAIIAVIAYGASLLTTFLPARQAAQVYPAEALRFE